MAKKYANFFHSRRGNYNMYFIKFVMYEIGNLMAIVVVFMLKDYFLAGKFKDYGTKVYEHYFIIANSSQEARVNPMCNVFPTLVRICKYAIQ